MSVSTKPRAQAAGGSSTALLAIRLADAFRGGAPTVEWLMHHVAMSRATAYRLRAVFLQARGEQADG